MQQVETHHDLDAPAAMVWALLADFANIEGWWPTDDETVMIERVEIEGEGIGQIRHIYNQGFPLAVSERLDYLDPDSLNYKLSIVGDRPAGLLYYQANGWIDVLPGNRCRLNYRGEFTAKPGHAEEAEAFLRAAYALMFKGLNQTCRRLQEAG
ncbi:MULTISPECIES: SRPBCC family protein [Pseudomonas]|uniref:SRPBCC family protein n=1 Tax=Pseudomonas TaxID=286 RepID=UPI001239F106|nr:MULTISPECIES: SRPBCC family protein [Pseudomonas]QIB51193.1 SRPBCC family protein [Pseudomonas sp. OIL-1]